MWKLLNPWPNGLPSKRRLRTCVYFRLCLARACVHLRWLVKTCVHFGRNQICTEIYASFHRLATQHRTTQVEWHPLRCYSNLLANEIKMSVFATWVYLRGNSRVRLAINRKSLRKFNLLLHATPCESILLGLNPNVVLNGRKYFPHY